MTIQHNKKDAERAFLDLVSELYAGFPSGKIVSSESPDFIIQSGPKKKIGVELTRYDRPGFSPRLSKSTLLELIRSKEQKLRIYQNKRLSGIWLVILADGFSNSPVFNFRNQLENWKIESRFDTVLLLDLMGEKVYDLYRR